MLMDGSVPVMATSFMGMRGIGAGGVWATRRRVRRRLFRADLKSASSEGMIVMRHELAFGGGAEVE
jgi:hypothetical protein